MKRVLAIMFSLGLLTVAACGGGGDTGSIDAAPAVTTDAAVETIDATVETIDATVETIDAGAELSDAG